MTKRKAVRFSEADRRASDEHGQDTSRQNGGNHSSDETATDDQDADDNMALSKEGNGGVREHHEESTEPIHISEENTSLIGDEKPSASAVPISVRELPQSRRLAEEASAGRALLSADAATTAVRALDTLPIAFGWKFEILWLIVFAVYVRTLYPTIAGGDSGELVSAMCAWGSAHPPGYPLFILLGNVFTAVIPYGPIAYRVNIMCALLTALAARFLQRASFLATRSFGASIIAAGMYAFSPYIWLNAVQAEVFAMNNFFACLLVYLLLDFWRIPSQRKAGLGAFVCGLALTNQHTIVFFVTTITLSVVWRGRSFIFSLKNAFLLTFLVLLGMTPYLQIAAINLLKSPPRYSWGRYNTLDGIIHHFLRKVRLQASELMPQDYGTFNLAIESTKEFGDRVTLGEGLFIYALSFGKEALFVGFPFAVVGLVACLAFSGPKLLQPKFFGPSFPGSLTVAIVFLFYTIVFHILANLPIRHPLFRGVHARFWLQSNALAFLFTSIGVHGVLCALLSKRRKREGVLMAIAVLLVYSQVSVNFKTQDMSKSTIMRDMCLTALQPLPKYGHASVILTPCSNSIILTSGDLHFNPCMYFSVCEKFRPDVRLLSFQLMSYEWYNNIQRPQEPKVEFPGTSYWPTGYSMQSFVRANIDTHPIFMWGGSRPGVLSFVMEDVSMVFRKCI